MRTFRAVPGQGIVSSTLLEVDGLSYRDKIKLAKNSSDLKELEKLASDNSALVKFEVYKNKNTPPEIKCDLEQDLADFKNESIRVTVAKCTDNPDLLAKLSCDSNAWVRLIVARRTDDSEILEKLSDDENRYVRDEVARRRR